jgi:hypothetical protein
MGGDGGYPAGIGPEVEAAQAEVIRCMGAMAAEAGRLLRDGLTPFVARHEILDQVEAARSGSPEAICRTWMGCVDAILDAYFANRPATED